MWNKFVIDIIDFSLAFILLLLFEFLYMNVIIAEKQEEKLH